MSQIPLVRANNYEPVLGALKTIGAPVERLITEIKFPIHILELAPDSFVPEHQLWYLLENASRSQGIENFGYVVATQSSPSDLGTLGQQLCESSTNLYNLLTHFCQTVQQHSTDCYYWLESHPDSNADETLFCRLGSPLSVGRWQAEQQYVMVILIQLVRMVAGPNWYPDKIYFETTELEGIKQCELFANSCLYYGQPKTAITIPNKLLPQVSPGKTPLDKFNAMELSNIPSSVSDRLKTALFHFVDEDKFDIATVCEIAGTRPRSLQRWLAREGMSFSKLVAQIRFEKASQLLRDPDISIIDISILFGYSDPAHFTRAFRRWCGVSPAAYRAQCINKP